MHDDPLDLPRLLRFLDNDELLRRYRTHRSDDLAWKQLVAELRRRELPLPPRAAFADAPADAQDFVTVARYFVPTEAHIVCGCLLAAGVPAAVADAHLNQTDSLLTPALGGVRILVPASCLRQAKEVIDAYNRGEYQLEDDVDVGGG
jgi:hypothetical protein